MIELNFLEMCGGKEKYPDYNYDISKLRNPIYIVMYVDTREKIQEDYYLYEYDGTQYNLVMM